MYKRVLLKLSGEALAADRGFGVDVAKLHEISLEILAVRDLGVEVAIVVGGGNFFRGVAEQARMMDRVSADHMGMLATVINSLALQDALEKCEVQTRVMSAIEMNLEIKADVLLKATKVEGIYNADPVITKDAVKFEQITYMEILRLGLKVMDSTAVSLCKDNNLPMIIFNMNRPGNILRVVSGEKVGSLVTA